MPPRKKGEGNEHTPRPVLKPLSALPPERPNRAKRIERLILEGIYQNPNDRTNYWSKDAVGIPYATEAMDIGGSVISKSLTAAWARTQEHFRKTNEKEDGEFGQLVGIRSNGEIDVTNQFMQSTMQIGPGVQPAVIEMEISEAHKDELLNHAKQGDGNPIVIFGITHSHPVSEPYGTMSLSIHDIALVLCRPRAGAIPYMMNAVTKRKTSRGGMEFVFRTPDTPILETEEQVNEVIVKWGGVQNTLHDKYIKMFNALEKNEANTPEGIMNMLLQSTDLEISETARAVYTGLNVLTDYYRSIGRTPRQALVTAIEAAVQVVTARQMCREYSMLLFTDHPNNSDLLVLDKRSRKAA